MSAVIRDVHRTFGIAADWFFLAALSSAQMWIVFFLSLVTPVLDVFMDVSRSDSRLKYRFCIDSFRVSE
jgi:hypothetical protein